MNCIEGLSLFLGVCAPLLAGGVPAQREHAPEKNAGLPGVSVTLKSLQITDTAIELRCDIRNDSGQDIWLYSRGSADPSPPLFVRQRGSYVRDVNDYGNARAFMDKDGETFLIARRMNPPSYDVVHTVLPWVAIYHRLRTGESRADVLSLALPVKGNPFPPPGFMEANDRGIATATRLAFEVGYYTTSRLQSGHNPRFGDSYKQRVLFNKTSDEATIRDLSEGDFWKHELAVRMTVDGLNIPLSEWVDVDLERFRKRFHEGFRRMYPPAGIRQGSRDGAGS